MTSPLGKLLGLVCFVPSPKPLRFRSIVRWYLPGLLSLAGVYASTAVEQPKALVSYYSDVRPIFQANCQGCHQPAKSKGGYVMSEFKRLLSGGDTEGNAIVPQHPEKSALLKMVQPHDGEVRMPKSKSPLSAPEVALIAAWIEQGAQDDTPADAKRHFDLEHPPVYFQPPVVTAIDFSPDGKLLAVAGFHEVLLYQPDNGELVARLIGLSERVQSLRFSPDGQSLAVAAGDPARSGEIQVWEVERKKLSVSAPVSYDTLYGVSWSPDGKLIAFGCPDNTLRVIEAASGKQVVQMGSHSDWVMSTTFSVDGDYIISGGRDMSVKLTELATQRFVDNVTSITPGALKGGVLALATHPKIEHIVAAGSDGLPKVYRIFRQTKREIGDDAQFMADLFPMRGSVFSARFSADGKRIVCGSSLDKTGEVVVCSYDYTNDVATHLTTLTIGKVPGKKTAEEKNQLSNYKAQGIREVARVSIPDSGIYSVAFSPDGAIVAAAGSDGKVRFIDATNGTVTKTFLSVPLTKPQGPVPAPVWASAKAQPLPPVLTPEVLPEDATVSSLELNPPEIRLTSRNQYAQVLVTAHLSSGEAYDVTRLVTFSQEPGLVEISRNGIVRPVTNGVGKLLISWGDSRSQAAMKVSNFTEAYPADFVKDVSPILARLGCNAGTCHGAKEGKGGFKLSLRGYDPETDERSLTDELASRRVNLASPDDSLMLLKAIAEVPHEGGRRTTVGTDYYQVIRQWIVNGATLDKTAPRVTKIEIFPQDTVLQRIGSRQQMRVLANYGDGTMRDVTAEAFIESGNMDVATSDGTGLVSTLRRGEAPILARYEGSYAATTLTVMGDRTGFVWEAPPTWGKIDELVAAKWQRMKILPSELCTDTEFIRRIYLDLAGQPPSADAVRGFLSDARASREKRDELIDHLIGSPEYIDYWANKWADLLQCNSKFLGSEGVESFRAWIRTQVEKNTPYNQLVQGILTASGSNRENPAASYWKILRTPTEAMENTTHLFLATRFNCNKCHDHPFERWTQDQYYQLSAFFAQVSLKEDPLSQGKTIAGTDVDGAKPLYEVVTDASEGEVKHNRTGKISSTVFPFAVKHEVGGKAIRREQLAAWITSADNRLFASSYANRIWGYLTGAGIIEPLDDTRAGNPPRNPALLTYLTDEFVKSGFNVRHLMQMISKSRTYQLSIRPNQWNQDDRINYSHAIARRLPAEVLFDAVFKVTGSMPQIPGSKPGQFAMQLADGATDVGSGLLATLGRPARQSACECERNGEIRLGGVLALLSGPTVSSAINDPTNALAKLVETENDDPKVVNEVFMRVLNRPAARVETENALALFGELEKDHALITEELGPLEAKLAPEIAELERERAQEIAHARTNLVIYDDFTKTLHDELEKRRQTGVSSAERALKDYETLLPAQAAFWETKLGPTDSKTMWVPIKAEAMDATAEMKLVQQNDLVITSAGSAATSDYLITTHINLTNITGVMLEVLPDDALPKFGPGWHPDGNFVLSELGLKWAAGTNLPDTTAKFSDAKADFSQNGYSPAQAVDGKVETGRNGWAIAGAPAIQRHTATFKLEKPIMATNGITLRFILQQHWGDRLVLGRFRLFLTAAENPLDFGLPEPILQAIRAPAGQRKSEQVAALVDFYRSSDADFWKRKQDVVKASEPLPKDPKLLDLEKALEKAQEPVRLDPHLVALRDASQASTSQLNHRRLTVVQDVAWALINSAAFLFNH